MKAVSVIVEGLATVVGVALFVAVVFGVAVFAFPFVLAAFAIYMFNEHRAR
jgi:hypothetical protein